VADEFIFVYGTLRRACTGNMPGVLTRFTEYVAEGYMLGKLYEVAGYPGAVEAGGSDDRVHGEIYRILDNDLLFALLDAYEECSEQFPQPHEYVRKKRPISLSGNGGIVAWVYLYNLDVTSLPQIASGDYLSVKKD
jgi:gamma-glutamylcyclotransferase (GGCT)/AIG2-like uncharacterized protein YtfP